MDAREVLGNLFDGGFITLQLVNPSFQELISPSFKGGYLGAVAFKHGLDFVQFIFCHRTPARFPHIAHQNNADSVSSLHFA